MVVFEMIFDPTLAQHGVKAISLVEVPAIESNFITLRKDQPVKLAADQERRVVMGAVLIPDKPILRVDPKTNEEFYIYFSKNTVQSVAEHFLLRGLQRATTVAHVVNAKGITLVESWLVVDAEKDKSAFYELGLPVGSWVAALKVEDDKLWNDYIKTGQLQGFSIEGFFGMEMRDMIVDASGVTRLTHESLDSVIEKLANKFEC